jgi:hypothetical protein
MKFSRYTLLAAAMLALSHSVPAVAVDEKVTTAADQKGIAVTIYNDNLALVKDARQVCLDRDLNRLAWREVSAQMRPETAQLRNLSHPQAFACRSRISISTC